MIARVSLVLALLASVVAAQAVFEVGDLETSLLQTTKLTDTVFLMRKPLDGSGAVDDAKLNGMKEISNDDSVCLFSCTSFLVDPNGNIDGDLRVDGNLVLQNLFISSDWPLLAQIEWNLIGVNEVSRFGNVATTTLNASDVTLSSATTITGDASVNRTLDVAVTTTLQDMATTDGTVRGDLAVADDVRINGELHVAGEGMVGSLLLPSEMSTLSVGRNVTDVETMTTQELHVTDSALFQQSADVDGTTSCLRGAAPGACVYTVLDTIDVDDINHFEIGAGSSLDLEQGTAETLKVTELAEINALNPGVVDPAMDAHFLEWLNVTTRLHVTANSTHQGTVSVSGDIEQTAGVGIETLLGTVTVATLEALDSATFGKNVDVERNAHVLGSTQLDGQLTVSENTTLGGALHVDGDAHFLANVVVDETLNVSLTAEFQSNLHVESLSVVQTSDLIGEVYVDGDTTMASNMSTFFVNGTDSLLTPDDLALFPSFSIARALVGGTALCVPTSTTANGNELVIECPLNSAEGQASQTTQFAQRSPSGAPEAIVAHEFSAHMQLLVASASPPNLSPMTSMEIDLHLCGSDDADATWVRLIFTVTDDRLNIASSTTEPLGRTTTSVLTSFEVWHNGTTRSVGGGIVGSSADQTLSTTLEGVHHVLSPIVLRVMAKQTLRYSFDPVAGTFDVFFGSSVSPVLALTDMDDVSPFDNCAYTGGLSVASSSISASASSSYTLNGVFISQPPPAVTRLDVDEDLNTTEVFGNGLANYANDVDVAGDVSVCGTVHVGGDVTGDHELLVRTGALEVVSLSNVSELPRFVATSTTITELTATDIDNTDLHVLALAAIGDEPDDKISITAAPMTWVQEPATSTLLISSDLSNFTTVVRVNANGANLVAGNTIVVDDRFDISQDFVGTSMTFSTISPAETTNLVSVNLTEKLVFDEAAAPDAVNEFSVRGRVFVEDTLTIDFSTPTPDNALIVNQTLSVRLDGEVTNLTVVEGATMCSLLATGDSTLDDDATWVGGMQLDGDSTIEHFVVSTTLAVEQTSHFEGDVMMQSALAVDGVDSVIGETMSVDSAPLEVKDVFWTDFSTTDLSVTGDDSVLFAAKTLDNAINYFEHGSRASPAQQPATAYADGESNAGGFEAVPGWSVRVQSDLAANFTARSVDDILASEFVELFTIESSSTNSFDDADRHNVRIGTAQMLAADAGGVGGDVLLRAANTAAMGTWFYEDREQANRTWAITPTTFGEVAPIASAAQAGAQHVFSNISLTIDTRNPTETAAASQTRRFEIEHSALFLGNSADGFENERRSFEVFDFSTGAAATGFANSRSVWRNNAFSINLDVAPGDAALPLTFADDREHAVFRRQTTFPSDVAEVVSSTYGAREVMRFFSSGASVRPALGLSRPIYGTSSASAGTESGRTLSHTRWNEVVLVQPQAVYPTRGLPSRPTLSSPFEGQILVQVCEQANLDTFYNEPVRLGHREYVDSDSVGTPPTPTPTIGDEAFVSCDLDASSSVPCERYGRDSPATACEQGLGEFFTISHVFLEYNVLAGGSQLDDVEGVRGAASPTPAALADGRAATMTDPEFTKLSEPLYLTSVLSGIVRPDTTFSGSVRRVDIGLFDGTRNDQVGAKQWWYFPDIVFTNSGGSAGSELPDKRTVPNLKIRFPRTDVDRSGAAFPVNGADDRLPSARELEGKVITVFGWEAERNDGNLGEQIITTLEFFSCDRCDDVFLANTRPRLYDGSMFSGTQTGSVLLEDGTRFAATSNASQASERGDYTTTPWTHLRQNRALLGESAAPSAPSSDASVDIGDLCAAENSVVDAFMPEQNLFAITVMVTKLFNTTTDASAFEIENTDYIYQYTIVQHSVVSLQRNPGGEPNAFVRPLPNVDGTLGTTTPMTEADYIANWPAPRAECGPRDSFEMAFNVTQLVPEAAARDAAGEELVVRVHPGPRTRQSASTLSVSSTYNNDECLCTDDNVLARLNTTVSATNASAITASIDIYTNTAYCLSVVADTAAGSAAIDGCVLVDCRLDAAVDDGDIEFVDVVADCAGVDTGAHMYTLTLNEQSP